MKSFTQSSAQDVELSQETGVRDEKLEQRHPNVLNLNPKIFSLCGLSIPQPLDVSSHRIIPQLRTRPHVYPVPRPKGSVCTRIAIFFFGLEQVFRI